MDKKINEIATIITEKINSLSLSTNDYVSTENMLPSFNGITQASSIPSGNVSRFRISDILISNIRPYFRKIWFSNRDGGCSNDVIILRANEGKVLPKYLYYALTNDYFINYYVASCKGTKMPRGNKDALLEWVLDVPSREIQQHIVNTISFLLLKFL
jgi:type I restriction enzyme S subunit